jgi:CMP-N,N'-diacetyllegionaminic acid synthase
MGLPLLAHTCKLVSHLREIDKAVVSTDSDEIGSCAERFGVSFPFRRPDELSGDRIGDFEVIEHALWQSEKRFSTKFDYIMLLQPTCPLRKEEDIRACLERIDSGNYSSVWTVSRTDLKYHPLKQLKLSSDHRLSLFNEDGKKIIARQQLQPTFTRNGACYVLSRDCILNKEGMLPNNAGYVEIDREIISIDTLSDFLEVEKLISEVQI